MRLYDTDFLAGAYETLLGRPLDITGVQSYLTVMREGHDREFIIYSLATSPEGVRFQSQLDGLPQFLALQRRLRSRPFGIFLRVIYGLRRQRLLANRLENMVGGLDSRMTRLERAPLIFRDAIVTNATAPENNYETDAFMKSPRARDIFELLKPN